MTARCHQGSGSRKALVSDPLPAMIADYFGACRRAKRLQGRYVLLDEKMPKEIKRLGLAPCCAEPLTFGALRVPARLARHDFEVKQAWGEVLRINGRLTPQQRAEIRKACRAELDALKKAQAVFDATPEAKALAAAMKSADDAGKREYRLRNKIVRTAPRTPEGTAASLRLFRSMAIKHGPTWQWGRTMAKALGERLS